jgi:hypothetical protein
MIALASLSESARKIALDRFRLLQPHLEEKRPLRMVARDSGIGYRTAQRWVMRYRKCGLVGLAREPSLPTLSIASAMISPIVVSQFAETVATCAISVRSETFLEIFANSAQ